jgi:hypothetical protein
LEAAAAEAHTIGVFFVVTVASAMRAATMGAVASGGSGLNHSGRRALTPVGGDSL